MDGKPAAELFPLEQECFHAEYEKYFKGKRQNFFTTLTAFRPLWDCLQLLNDICAAPTARRSLKSMPSFILAESLWNDLGILGPQLAGHIRSFHVNDDTRANFGVGVSYCQSNIGVDRVFTQQWGTAAYACVFGDR